ncbi:MAG: nuclear transport factor 2 family protein [Pseudomonadales bacterium]|jgi:hypothetical protein|nr:nuclear transport factor 2 family protein [Pseudomonadales bacterium]MDP6829229.1 nuclear transport factor 2 family protein [Pseudomonadales bacterium]MDP6972626.1 nuclear transport factor 2 family protein [Pseudomonadales bacterium]|tara:strand:- start:1554 stop:2063 length:510 start_codon:yes stop_codon:yes gene_type:complete
MDSQLQELLDKKACEEVLMRYGRTQDWLDTPGQESCYWPDADIDFGFFEGNGTDWVKTVMPHEEQAKRRWHMCTSVLVEVDGNKAAGECYGITVATRDTGDGGLVDVMFGGRYLDELEKREGEWRISKRTYILDWAHQFPNSLDAVTGKGFALNILDISKPGHPMYRPL